MYLSLKANNKLFKIAFKEIYCKCIYKKGTKFTMQ